MILNDTIIELFDFFLQPVTMRQVLISFQMSNRQNVKSQLPEKCVEQSPCHFCIQQIVELRLKYEISIAFQVQNDSFTLF